MRGLRLLVYGVDACCLLLVGLVLILLIDVNSVEH